MTEETLDNLLADHALGALPPDTAALLEAYLAANPAAQNNAAHTHALVHLARQALADTSPRELTLPPLHFPASRRWRTAAWTALATTGMAACLALGFWCGSARPAQSPTNSPIATTVNRAPPAGQTAVASTGGAAAAGGGAKDFWSVQRLRAYAAQQPAVENPAPPRRNFWTLGQIGG